MNVQTFYPIVEGLILTGLGLQLILYVIKSRPPFIGDFEIQLFIIVCILNHLGVLFFSKHELSFFFYHASGPAALILGILLTKRIGPVCTLLSLFVVSITLLLLNEYSLYVLMYYLAIFLSFRKGLQLTRRSNHELKKAILYLVLSLDLYASMIVLVLKNTDYNWEQSDLISYMYIASLLVFTTTLILLNVKLRRFFTD